MSTPVAGRGHHCTAWLSFAAAASAVLFASASRVPVLSFAARPTGAGTQGTPTNTRQTLVNWHWCSRYSYKHTTDTCQLALVLKVLLQTHDRHLSTGTGTQSTPTNTRQTLVNWHWCSRYSYKHTTDTCQLALVLKVLLQTHDRNLSTGTGTQSTPTNTRQTLVNWHWYSKYSYKHTPDTCQLALVLKVLLQTHDRHLSTGTGAQGTPTNTRQKLVNWHWYSKYSYKHTPDTCQLALVLKVLLQTHDRHLSTGTGAQGTPTNTRQTLVNWHWCSRYSYKHTTDTCQLALVLKVLLQTHDRHLSTGTGAQGTPTNTRQTLVNWHWCSRYSYKHTTDTCQLALVLKVLLQTHARHLSTGTGTQSTPTNTRQTLVNWHWYSKYSYKHTPDTCQLALVLKVLLQTHARHLSTGTGAQSTPTNTRQTLVNWHWCSRYSYKHTTDTCQLALVLKVLLQTHDRHLSTGTGAQGTPTNTRQTLVNWHWYSKYSYKHTTDTCQLALVLKVLLQTHDRHLSTGTGAQGTPTNTGQTLVNWRWCSRYSYKHMPDTCQLALVLKVLLQTHDRHLSTGAGTQGTHTNTRQTLVNWSWYSRYSYKHMTDTCQLELVLNVLIQTHDRHLSTGAGTQGTPTNTQQKLVNWSWYSRYSYKHMTDTCQLALVLKVLLQTYDKLVN